MDTNTFELERTFDVPLGHAKSPLLEPGVDRQTSPEAEALASGLPPTAEGLMTRRTHVFIDADNQSPTLAPALFRFLASVGRSLGGATIAGNGSGDRVKGWEKALSQTTPHVPMTTHVAPMRKQSADVRLMFELAKLYHGQPDPDLLLVVVSRDDLLLAAAECLNAQGHKVLLAVGASSPAMPLVTDLPVVVLPAPQPSVPAAVVNMPPATNAPASAANGVDPKVVAAAVAKIRESLTPQKGGGYEASAIGQVLSKLGHDKATRTRILAAIPNLKEIGAGSDKRLVF
jgi:hypothetical protein